MSGLEPYDTKVPWIRIMNIGRSHKDGGPRRFEWLGASFSRLPNHGLKNCTVQTNFIAIGEAQPGEMHAQSGSSRARTSLGQLIDYAFHVGRRRNRDFGTDNHGILGFQVDDVTAASRFSVD
jgi:hypothetical protein